MLHKKSLFLVFITLLMISVLFTGCLNTDIPESDWAAKGGDPAFSKQNSVPDEQLVIFGEYPQSLADGSISAIISSKVKIDEVTGLWTVYNVSASVDENGKKRTDSGANEACWEVRYIRTSEIEKEDEYTYNKQVDGTTKIITKEQYEALDEDLRSNYIEDQVYYLGWTGEDGLVHKTYTGAYSSYDVQSGYYSYYTYTIDSIHANSHELIGDKEEKIQTNGNISYFAQANGLYYIVEPIKWIVLEETDSEYVLITASVIDSGRPFNDLYMNVKWDESSIRDWLNGTDEYDDETGSKYNGTWNFFDKAFTDEQAASILTTTNKTPAVELYGSASSADTEDKVYFLSVEEFNKYFITANDGEDSEKTLYPMGFATAYAMKRGATSGKYDEVSWWLRTSGADNYSLAVNRVGLVGDGGYSISDTDIGIRPVIRVAKSAIQK